MLQQILTDMFIEPELLAELNEDQKQTLFFKMREEQVRRWKERDAQQVKEEVGSKRPKKDPAKSVSWMKASDGDDWVWVMGDHPEDKSYDQICDGIMAQRAALQAQKEAEELRAKKEAELEKRFSAVHLDPELVLAAKEVELREEEARQAAAKEQLRLKEELKKEEAERCKAEEEVRGLEEARAQQIYMDLKDVQKSRQHQDKEDKEDKAWQETLRKSKVADQRRLSIAKQTREDYRRRSVKALEQGRVSSVTKALGGEKPALPPKPKPRNLTVTSDVITQKPGVRRTPSCSSPERIIQWFRDEQLPLRAGFQRDQSRIATWFHGIISRQEAEDLLSEKGPGYFLIRVSERILGYVLSHCSQEGCKHFLIDATDNCYMLLGDQLSFSSLVELVEYHEVEALTPSGGEQLLHACGQSGGTVDYADLFTRV
ncbi:SH2 domain-containing protein 4A isoform X2 [Clupea harengus]|uniref:SH2 domain-containing protein 4A isoform X2 n=1 Tax=Clupea harengus TaxID=7950 RepID=A0A6P8G262_CLUHA|nr:SH2 domain-containing protein 4A-like isoform X2 [Clupea harengus]XP_031434043.1 SH2 domain-containing protein 4A isoform X2 [Clupea harengus]